MNPFFQVKHWIDPNIIPFGWGLFSENEEVIMIDAAPGLGEGEEELPMTVFSVVVNPSHLMGGRGAGGQGEGRVGGSDWDRSSKI